ncbi:MAG: lysophospholipid acyltransferase family protein [Candidatus Omnitrophica bacterium]|nr:lysophospholipid acyltransferase family protein [Candidatus Omnitrophota bacterium]
MKIKAKRYYLYGLLKIFYFLTSLLPIRVISYIGVLCGRIGFYLSTKQRHITIEHLKRSFPEKSSKEIYVIAKKVFENIVRSFAEFSQAWKITTKNKELWFIDNGMDKVKACLKQGKGCIILIGHLGNWEFFGQYFPLMGVKASTIVKDMYFYKYNIWLSQLRKIKGLGLIDRREKPRQLLKLLKSNIALGILADQDIESIEGIFVDFFKKKAYTPIAPVKLAMVTGAPIVPCFMVRVGKRYRFIAEDPIFIIDEKGKEKQESIRKYTEKWSAIFEQYITKYPEQWVWMHRRWKTRPAMEG